ncbi:MAG: helix-turn-helix domain-containing protein [Candidatus Cryptobacteroides sp.]
MRAVFTIITLLQCALMSAYSLVRPNVYLSNNAVLAIYQDERGYMWFGTYDGLHSWNGRDTEVYRMELDNDKSLASNIIVKIVPSGSDYIWVSTSMGLSRFSTVERTVSESYMQYREVYEIASDNVGNTLLVSRDDFVSVYIRDKGTFVDIPAGGIRLSDVTGVWSPGEGEFNVLSRDGYVRRFRIDGENVEDSGTFLVSDNPVKSAFYEEGVLYFLDENATLFSLSNVGEDPVFLSDLSGFGDAGLSVSGVSNFGNQLYLSFYAGFLGCIPATGGRCEMVASDYRIFCIEKDIRQDILWLGTDGYGVFMYCDKEVPFKSILMSDLPLSIKKPVRGVYTDVAGNLFLGTKGDGIIRIKEYSSLAESVPPSSIRRFTTSNGLSSNEVYSFCPDGDLIWIGTSGRELNWYLDNGDGGSIGSVNAELGGPVHQMCSPERGTLYLASDGEGLVRMKYVIRDGKPCMTDRKLYRFRHRNIDCNNFYAIAQESDSTLLIGLKSGYGIIRFNMAEGSYSFLDMSSLQSRALGDILSLCTDSGDIYCGSSSGLIRICNDGVVTKYSKDDGLANDMVHGVLADGRGNVWLSSNKGLTQFNPKTVTFHNFSPNELAVSEFSDDSYWHCPSTGRLFFGGVNGVVWVDSLFRQPSGYRPDVIFESISFPDGVKMNFPGGEDAPDIRIRSGIRKFTVNFVAIDYLNGENFEYSYRIDDFAGGEWTELQKSGSVTFQALPPGRHTLWVRYRGSASDESVGEASLDFRVLPPWYASTVALLCYIFIVLSAALYAIRLTRLHYKKQQQEALAEAEEEHLKQLDQARMDFFVNISHELCTPLTLINGITEHLKDSLAGNPDYAKYLGILSSNVTGLRELVEEILNFRMIEGEGFGKLRIMRTDVAAAIREYMHSFDELAAGCRISLSSSVNDVLEWNTDRSCFKKIIFNLVSNALKYTPFGGYVTVAADVTESGLELRVRNSGEGLTEDQMAVIFDRYKILDEMSSNMYAGTTRHGLGLFICKSLVNSLGGEINVSSIRGSWVEFKVVLPQLDENVAGQTGVMEEMPELPHPEHSSDGELPVILIVDDNKDIRWLLSDALSDSYRVVEASGLGEAEAILEKSVPDLIITDVVMDGKDDGFELVRRLRADKYRRSIPVIVCSARVTEQDQIEGMDSGADAYFTKPFSVSVVKASVERLLSNRKMLKDWYDAPESARTIVNSKVVHNPDKEFVDKAILSMKENLTDENFNLERLADLMGLSSRNFYRRFKKITGQTPSEFLKQYRFESAARLLKNSDMTVQEVMYGVGISNKSYFYREFTKIYGKTPKEYRQG